MVEGPLLGLRLQVHFPHASMAFRQEEVDLLPQRRRLTEHQAQGLQLFHGWLPLLPGDQQTRRQELDRGIGPFPLVRKPRNRLLGVSQSFRLDLDISQREQHDGVFWQSLGSLLQCLKGFQRLPLLNRHLRQAHVAIGRCGEQFAELPRAPSRLIPAAVGLGDGHGCRKQLAVLGSDLECPIDRFFGPGRVGMAGIPAGLSQPGKAVLGGCFLQPLEHLLGRLWILLFVGEDRGQKQRRIGNVTPKFPLGIEGFAGGIEARQAGGESGRFRDIVIGKAGPGLKETDFIEIDSAGGEACGREGRGCCPQKAEFPPGGFKAAHLQQNHRQ